MDKGLITTGRLHPRMTFNERVWALCARVPRGKVATYGEIAHKLGTRAYRAVGNALHKNPYAQPSPVTGSSAALATSSGLHQACVRNNTCSRLKGSLSGAGGSIYTNTCIVFKGLEGFD